MLAEPVALLLVLFACVYVMQVWVWVDYKGCKKAGRESQAIGRLWASLET